MIDARLHRDLTHGEVILNDRRVPDGHGNIDHIVVARSGVWIIDSKNWKGKIEFRGVKGPFDANEHLFVGGKDCSYLVDDIYAQVIPIVSALNDRSIPVYPAIVFVDGDWKSTVRLLRNKAYHHNGVSIAWPKCLISQIRESGPLSVEQVASIGDRLDHQLAAM